MRFIAFACALTCACSGPTEPKRVSIPTTIQASSFTSTTAKGYAITLSDARIAARDLHFSVGGEAHTAWYRRASELLISRAVAHPGHYQGGAVTGELSGEFLLDYVHPSELGAATLLTGNYESMSFTLRKESALDDHSMLFAGSAGPYSFTISVDSPEGREIVGVPFEAVIAGEGGTIVCSLLIQGLFDAIDFAAHAQGTVVAIAADDVSEDYLAFKRTIQSHNQFKCEIQ